VTVRDKSSDRDLLEAALVENVQREDLNPLEAAEAYARLKANSSSPRK
jgi:ParB family chromosome partitioning protein